MNRTEEIRRDLARTVIKEPLYAMIRDTANADRELAVIAEVNEDYYLGGERAAAQLSALFGSGPIGNRYFQGRLLPAAILAIVEADYQEARARQAGSATPLARYLAIRRVWFNHPVRPLLDKSVSTIKADAAHRAFLAEGKDIVWAVVDSGIDGAHRHFEARRTLSLDPPLAHCDFTGGNSPLTDEFGHGTHVAGIVAGSLAGEGPCAVAQRTRLADDGQIESFDEPLCHIEGIAPSCRLVSLKVLDNKGQGEVANILAAIDRIQTVNDFGRNIRIHGVNLSVGYEFDPAWFACGQSPVCAEVDRLVRSGVVVVIAAGNTGYGALASDQRTTGGGMMLTINDPGNADLAITVGSTHRDAPHTYGVSYFSSKGPTGDGRMKPDLVAPGERILSCCSTAQAAGQATNIYVEDSGTSMAAPHVSGAIAAFLSIRREYIGNPAKVKELFLSTATDLGRNCYFQGHGLLDLMRAIQSV
jgi:serine protease AprX